MIKAVCERAREEGAIKQGRPKKNEEKVKSDNYQTFGTDPTYLARRILTEHPETFEKLEAGEFRSVRAAAKECGMVKERKVRSIPIDSPDDALRALAPQ